MKKSLLSLFFIMCALTLSAKPNRQIVILSCNLHCQGCCDKVMKNIAFEKGVKDIQCDLSAKEVTVTFDANKTDVPTLLNAFEKIGKPATVKSHLAPRDSEPPTSPVQHADETPQTDANTGASILE